MDRSLDTVQNLYLKAITNPALPKPLASINDHVIINQEISNNCIQILFFFWCFGGGGGVEKI
jgi:hypothetical protein